MLCYTCYAHGGKSFGTLDKVIGPSWPEFQYNVCAAHAGEYFFGSKSKFLKAQVRKGLHSIKWHPWAYLLGTKDLGQDQTLGVDPDECVAPRARARVGENLFDQNSEEKQL